ncbi:hypothetical protein [Corynebacterium guangdongense]|uniref:Uncharacterized protein n=1 Tax=Corynebacterium guangdongense TaxID=1783348 RepID=A0ABU1ZY31_9CORY|nr:hypothetical protein [Corynebacterium guangdongense]MDR7329849.1 hypothetical protein [Corynebacterium guangdongense]
MKTRISLLSIAAAAVVTMSPTIAAADPIDDALAKLPAGEITCEQAESYWTTESEYEAIRAQAQIVATFHDRGDDIVAALARVDEAADRCGLKEEADGKPGTPATPAQPAKPATPAQPATPGPKGTPGKPEHAATPATPAIAAAPATPAEEDTADNYIDELLPTVLEYFEENRDAILAALPELSSEA